MKPRSGFTLIELLIVVAILTLLAGVLTPMVKKSIDDARIAKVLATAEALGKASKKYWYDTGELPTEDAATNIHDLFIRPAGPAASLWRGPYISEPLSYDENPWFGPIGIFSSLRGEGGNDGFKIGPVSIPMATPGCQFVMKSIPLALARRMDVLVDGQEDCCTGAFEFDPAIDPTSIAMFLFEKK